MRAPLAVLLLLAAGLAEAAGGHEAWRYRRSVEVPGEGAFAELSVPLEVWRHSQPELRDARLLSDDGTEVPYVLERSQAKKAVVSWRGQLVDQRREARQHSLWVVDLGSSRTFDRVDFEIGGYDFAKSLRVEISEDQKRWRVLRGDAGVFERDWGGRLRHTGLDLDASVTARWLRVTADDRRSRPIDISGLTVSATRDRAAAEWREAFTASPGAVVNGAARYALSVPPGTPAAELLLDADDPAFARLVTVYDVRTVDGERREDVLAEKRVYRLRVPDELLSVEEVRVPLSRPPMGELVLAVRDGDSPPLKRLRGSAAGAPTRLLFPAVARRLTLVYGNPVTRAPLYDLEAVRSRLSLASTLVPVTLGPETTNSAYAPPAPLPHVGTTGATVESSRWRWVRPVIVAGHEDIFTIRLSAADLAAARSDLADLRLVDEKDRQVPYILVAQAGEDRVPLAALPAASRDPRVRLLRLSAPDGAEPLQELPVGAIELTIAESFFSRPARLYGRARGDGRDRPLLASLTLARRDGVSGTEPAACRIELDGLRRPELHLEIDEGDNAPLTIRGAAALVAVPRLVFKAPPGSYRLLLGNPEAHAPQYDLATLRREVLAYSALPVTPGEREAHRRFRRSGRDYLARAPRTALLWGVLLAAVVGLLFVTVRILRSPAAS
jgi:hypothetical protein